MRTLWLPLLTTLLLTQSLACGNNDKPLPPSFNNTPPDATSDQDETPDLSIDEDVDEDEQSNSLSVSDQTIVFPDRIVVESFQSLEAGWLAVYEDDNGAPGPLLGTLSVEAGSSSDVRVQLDRELVDAEVVHVALHKDDPANGTFDYTANGSDDPIALDDQGESLVASITITLAPMSEPALEVQNQTVTQADVVTISSLVAPIDAWVVIYDSPAGTRANIIGTLKVAPGPAQDVQVTLDREVVNGETLYAVLHGDDPTDGNFTYAVNPSEDIPLLDNTNAEVERAFVVDIQSAGPQIDLGSFALSDNEVSIARVVTDEPSWIVIQDEINGQPGSVLGTSFVAPGENSNVYVFLQARDLNEGEKIYVTLHSDSPQDGNFSYVQGMPDDGPVVVAGQPIRQSVNVMLPMPIKPNLTVNPAVALTAANELFIQRADLDTDGWIAVYENNAGVPGARIGLQAISAGTNTNVPVTINQQVVDGELYIVRLHRDAPADGVFNHDADATQDPVALNDQGLLQRRDIQITALTDDLFVSSKDLTNLTTVFLIDTVNATQDSWVVLTNGAEYLGSVFIPEQSALSDVEIVTNRPLVDLEALTATLHQDMPADGVYDPNADPALQRQGDDLSVFFSPFIDPTIPAVRMTMNVINNQWRVLSVEPSEYISSLPGGLNTDAPTMSLKEGYRYAFVNNSLAAHPLEFILKGAMVAADNVQLSQAGGVMAPSEGTLDWTENQNTVTWTIPANANLLIDGYRSQSTPTVRGDITFRP